VISRPSGFSARRGCSFLRHGIRGPSSIRWNDSSAAICMRARPTARMRGPSTTSRGQVLGAVLDAQQHASLHDEVAGLEQQQLERPLDARGRSPRLRGAGAHEQPCHGASLRA
jgi:hypothetical protein